ncbi:MAG: S-layer homology domain-containing protein [Clostridia bacterium]|nr:S-layer homology domain-containing protein [Clostridia bacterium]
MRKKIISFLIALSAFNSTGVFAAFSDVSGEGAKEINALCEQGIIKGTSETTFSPDENITRAEFSALITRAFDIPQRAYENQFSDVSADDWFAGAVSAMHEMGIIEGYDGKFNPYDNITHEQSCKILSLIFEDRAEKVTYPYAYTSIYQDYFKISEWARDYVAKATMIGCVTYSTQDFRTSGDKGIQNLEPQKAQTRRETAICVYRTLNAVNNYKERVYEEE